MAAKVPNLQGSSSTWKLLG